MDRGGIVDDWVMDSVRCVDLNCAMLCRVASAQPHATMLLDSSPSALRALS